LLPGSSAGGPGCPLCPTMRGVGVAWICTGSKPRRTPWTNCLSQCSQRASGRDSSRPTDSATMHRPVRPPAARVRRRRRRPPRKPPGPPARRRENIRGGKLSWPSIRVAGRPAESGSGGGDHGRNPARGTVSWEGVYLRELRDREHQGKPMRWAENRLDRGVARGCHEPWTIRLAFANTAPRTCDHAPPAPHPADSSGQPLSAP
jgi:hypothetical protein